MTPAEKDAATIRQYRDRIDELEETIRQMRDAAAPRISLPVEWGLTRSQTRAVLALFHAPGGFLPIDNLIQTVVPKWNHAMDPQSTVRTQLFRARQKLAPFGVEILVRWGEGYELPAASRAVIKAAIEQRAAA